MLSFDDTTNLLINCLPHEETNLHYTFRGPFLFQFYYNKSSSTISHRLSSPRDAHAVRCVSELTRNNLSKRSKHVVLSAFPQHENASTISKSFPFYLRTVSLATLWEQDANILLRASLLLPVINGDKYEAWESSLVVTALNISILMNWR